MLSSEPLSFSMGTFSVDEHVKRAYLSGIHAVVPCYTLDERERQMIETALAQCQAESQGDGAAKKL